MLTVRAALSSCKRGGDCGIFRKMSGIGGHLDKCEKPGPERHICFCSYVESRFLHAHTYSGMHACTHACTRTYMHSYTHTNKEIHPQSYLGRETSKTGHKRG